MIPLINDTTHIYFLMIPLTFLSDEYIDQPKLSEQKNPFDYLVPPPPPHKWGRNKKRNGSCKTNIYSTLLPKGEFSKLLAKFIYPASSCIVIGFER